MIISVNWLKKFTDITVPINELATLIGSRLVEIEDIIDLGKKYEGVVIAKVVECAPLEGSDHLNVTKIDDGGVVKDIERDENGYVQVVCGAPNVRVGIMAAWLAPGVTLPETFDDPKPVVLEARSLRGVVSNGMLASPKELGLGESHEGILEITKDVKPGDAFADAYELNDYLLDIENKSLTHRPDTFGIVGFAREVAGIQGNEFKTPIRLQRESIEWIEKTGDEPTPKVTIDDQEASSRYQAVVLNDVDAKAQSPLETQSYLSRVGVRPHSAVVDATNYLMMVTGQPLHAFDYDKLKTVNGGEIDMHVRFGRAGEKLVLLDEREIELSENDIVIANGDTPVALAGAMGGRDTEIDDSTTNVLLESASFNLYNLRNTQMRHGIFSEAITRFTKGQPAELTEPVLAEAVRLLAISAGAKRASDVADEYPGKTETQPVRVSQSDINDTLGSNLGMEQITTTLANVGFTVDVEEPYMVVATAPYWRIDIHIPEDIIEEVGRLNGFDSIMPTLPKRDFTAVSPDAFDQLRARVRKTLARAGANEVLTYSFVHGDLLQKAGQDIAHAYRIVNSISPDLQYYRLTLTPSLLSLLHPNSKAGFDEFMLFELNKVHSKIFGMDSDDTPREVDLLALSYSGQKSGGTAYHRVKETLDYLGASLGLAFDYKVIDDEPGYDESAPYDHRRSAIVYDHASGEYIGIVGEYKAAVKKAFKLSDFTAGFELDPRALLKATESAGNLYRPLSRYPSTERDVCFQVDSSVRYAEIFAAASEGKTDAVEVSVSPLDIYQPEGSDTKNVTLRFVLTPYDKTLASEEANKIVDAISKNVIETVKASII
jgi:phenylalanyl-tRNA synthetase beta chain